MPRRGWNGESVRHSNARRTGRAGPMYKGAKKLGIFGKKAGKVGLSFTKTYSKKGFKFIRKEASIIGRRIKIATLKSRKSSLERKLVTMPRKIQHQISDIEQDLKELFVEAVESVE